MSSTPIKFSVDKSKAKEGEYVTVYWSCESPDAVSLTVDDGFSPSRVQLPDSGSRVIAIGKSNDGKTTLRLNVVRNGKVERKELEVKVETMKAAKAKKTKTAHTRKPISNPFRNLKSGWNSFIYRLKYGWQVMPDKKRRTYKVALYAIIALWLLCIARTCGYQAGYDKGQNEAIDRTEVSI